MTSSSKVIKDENGDLIIPLPEELTIEAGWEYGDELEVKYSDSRIDLINLSMKKLPVSRFKRELKSLSRKLHSESDPLERVLVTRCGKSSALVTRIEENDELKAMIKERMNQPEIIVNISDL